ncbi:hypothetical protein [Mycobacterium sp. NPDC050853]|nr:hypothetical protein [Mycobacteroides sp. LB1]
MTPMPAAETAAIASTGRTPAKERVFVVAVRTFAAITVIGSVAAITQLSYSPPRAPIVGYQIVNRDGSIPEGAIPIPVPPPGPQLVAPLPRPQTPSHPPGQAAGPFGLLPSVTDRGLPISVAAPCPFGWPAPGPDEQGGLASLIDVAPAAGVFSSEAFAPATAYEPILKMMGPVLARISPLLSRHPWGIDQFVTRFQTVMVRILEAILPYYGPYRGDVLKAEGDLAKALTPFLESLYNTPSAQCLVAWEAQRIRDARGGRPPALRLHDLGKVIDLFRSTHFREGDDDPPPAPLPVYEYTPPPEPPPASDAPAAPTTSRSPIPNFPTPTPTPAPVSAPAISSSL